jgi:glycosyltransferase involved in cell wall biosynthesis
MTRIISVITPIYRPEPEHLRAAYESLAAQELPPGWELEWVLQEDGTTGLVDELLPGDPRVTAAGGRHNGVAMTRNLGLSRARGELIKNLDQDDILCPGVLARDIEVLSGDDTTQWTTSRALDLLPDGSTVGLVDDPPAGRLEPGVVAEYWRTHDYRLPVHPATICVKRPLLVALGGWMAVPGSDDTGMLVAASMVSVGHFHRETGLFYRKWPGQASVDPAHTEPAEWWLRMRVIDERARTITTFWNVPPRL